MQEADKHYETTPMWTRTWPHGDRTSGAEAEAGGAYFPTDNVSCPVLGPDQRESISYRRRDNDGNQYPNLRCIRPVSIKECRTLHPHLIPTPSINKVGMEDGNAVSARPN